MRKEVFSAILYYCFFIMGSVPLWAGVCPLGDLDDDCAVSIADVAILAEQWLADVDCSGQTGCPELDGTDPVGLGDFAALASNFQVCWDRLIISEFMASNNISVQDGYGDSPDWIEIFNPIDRPVSLDGWSLTDNIDKPDKWAFPDGIVLNPGQYLLVFASNKDEQTFPENFPHVDPAGYWHTNFELSASGEYLALVRPEGTVSSGFFPEFPTQYEDISYGIGGLSDVVTQEHVLLDDAATASAKIPADDSLGTAWQESGFDDSDWLTGLTGIGYDYPGLVGLDVSMMEDVNPTVYGRVQFNVDGPSLFDTLRMELKYEDGFIAYLNGLEVASDNAPVTPVWNSPASENRPDAVAVNPVTFDLTSYKDALQVGTNVLAIHGLNYGVSSSDLIIAPKIIASSTTSASVSFLTEGYFMAPTPGASNSSSLANIGPRISAVTKNPTPPLETEALVITAHIAQTEHPVASVSLHYRVNYADEVTLTMQDNGLDADAFAVDGIYTAVIDAQAYAAGQMVRWYIEAQDTGGLMSRNPLFPDPAGSDEYFGTVVRDPALVTAMPVLHWFLAPENIAASNTREGTRTSLFYNGEFYDNVFVRIRGGSVAGLNKKSYKFEFNPGNHFRFDDRFGRVDEFNLNQTYTDKSYLRQLLSFKTYDMAGAAGSESFLYRVQQNGNFFSVAAFVEQPDKDLLKREGLDPTGALYKMYNGVTSSSAEKKTRRWEDNSDLAALVSGIHLSGQARTNYLFDNVDIPAVLNFLAASVLIQHDDDSKKNYYLYRDTNGTGEWRYLPWDVDLTFGRHFMTQDSILSDIIWAGQDYILGGSGQNVPIWPSHPFVDTEQTPGNRSWNHLTDALLTTPEFADMFRRRLRTVMDQILQDASVPVSQRVYESMMDEYMARISPDVDLDRQKWSWFGQSQTLAQANDILKQAYLDVTRESLFVSHNIDNLAAYDFPNSFSAEIPNAQPADAGVNFGVIEFNPASYNQDEEYIEIVNLNSYAVDLTGWQLTGGVAFEFKPGTVVRANASMYLSPNVKAFRQRAEGPTGNEGHFVQGNYRGHLSSWGEELTLIRPDGTVADQTVYAGDPSAQQRYLRITEAMYHPEQGGAYNEEEYEYLELKNIGTESLLLDGCEFAEGIVYAFEPGSNVELAPGQYLLLVRNRRAFESRYGTGLNIAGEYTGYFDNGGERVKLEDETNSTILEFTYKDGWYDITDGGGFSLTIKDPDSADLNLWDQKAGWRPSAAVGGSPGADDAGVIPAIGSVVINELLAHSDTIAYDWIELHNTTAQPINIGGWFLSDDNTDETSRRKYQIADGTSIPAGGYVVFYENTHFGNPSDPGCLVPFQFSENGETLYLQSGQSGVLTGYYEEESFGASDKDIAFGRYQKSTGAFNFVAMSDNTPGAANAYPKVGPVVITEIMYHPQTNGDAEYVELKNISGSSVTLYDFTTNEPWRFVDDADNPGLAFCFPATPVTMTAGQTILLIKNAAAFKAEYGTNSLDGVTYFEWLDGSLSNSGEKPELQMPGDVNATGERQYIRIDRVSYDDSAPWPTEPDGGGQSLKKIPAELDLYGNDVIHWISSTPTYH